MAELHVGKGQPHATLAAAAKVAKSGDVIIVHEGVYASGFQPPAGTTWMAAEGETAVIDGGWTGEKMSAASANATGVLVKDGDVTLSGFEVRNIKGVGVGVGPGGDGFTMRHCVIHDCVDGGFGANGTGKYIRDILIEDCQGYRLSMSGSFPGQETPVNGCWLFKMCDGVTVRRTSIFQGRGEGMAAGTRSKNVLFEDCTVGDTAHLAIYVNRAQDVVIRNCVTFHTGDPAWLQADGDPGANLVIGDEMSGDKSKGWQFSENVLIAGCLFIGGGAMFQVRYGLKPGNKPGAWDGYGTQIQNLEVRNCTFVSGARTKLGVNIGTGPDKTPIKAVLTGNLFVFDVMRPNGDPFKIVTKGATFERNAWSIPVPAGLPASNVRVPAAALVAPFATPDAALLLDNYRPRPGSVAVGYGALEPLPVEPPPPPPDPDPVVDWDALMNEAAAVGVEVAAAGEALAKAKVQAAAASEAAAAVIQQQVAAGQQLEAATARLTTLLQKMDELKQAAEGGEE